MLQSCVSSQRDDCRKCKLTSYSYYIAATRAFLFLCIPTHTYNPSHSFIHLLTHRLTHSPTHVLTGLLTHSLTYSPTHSPTHLLTHSVKAFDKDNSGYIDEKEFQHMIFKLGFRSDEMDSKSFKLLLQSINLNDKVRTHSLIYSLTYSLTHSSLYSGLDKH